MAMWNVINSTAFKAVVSLSAILVLFPAHVTFKHLTQSRMDALVRLGGDAETHFGLLLLAQGFVGQLCVALVTVLLMRWVGISHVDGPSVSLRGYHHPALLGIALGAGCFFILWWCHAIPPLILYRGWLGDPSGWVVIAGICLAAAIGVAEELYFRGLLYRQATTLMVTWMARTVNVVIFVAYHTWEYRGLLHLTFVGIFGYVCVRYTENDRTYTRAAICHALVNMTFYTLANVHVL
jgi:membrane protease YdiL (CAAX protease family)